jgi:hypothetical protein
MSTTACGYTAYRGVPAAGLRGAQCGLSTLSAHLPPESPVL